MISPDSARRHATTCRFAMISVLITYSLSAHAQRVGPSPQPTQARPTQPLVGQLSQLPQVSSLVARPAQLAQARPVDPAVPAQPSLPPEAAAPSNPTDVLELDEVLRSVTSAFPLLRAAERDRDVANAQLQTAHGGFDPTLRLRGAMTPTGPYTYGYFDAVVDQPTPLWGASFFVGYRFGQPMTPWGSGTVEIPTYDGRLQTNEFGEVRAGVNVPLWRDGPTDRRRTDLARADVGTRVAELTLTQQRIDYARVASVRYWDWVLSGARVRVAQQLLALATGRDAQLTARAVSGDIAAIERADNQRSVQARLAAVAMATRALEQASIELSLYLRDAAGQPVVVPAARLPALIVQPPDSEPIEHQAAALLERAIAQRPEISRLTAQREQSELDLRLAQNQLAPGINVSLAVAQDIGTQSSTRSRTEVTAGVVLDVPIPNRAAQGRIRVAEASVSRVQEQLRFARDRVVADVRDALSILAAARARATAARSETTLALEVERGERRRYEEGDATILLLNLREVATAEARLRVLEAFADYQRGLVALRAAEGRVPAP